MTSLRWRLRNTQESAVCVFAQYDFERFAAHPAGIIVFRLTRGNFHLAKNHSNGSGPKLIATGNGSPYRNTFAVNVAVVPR